MSDINAVYLTGNIGAQPEIKYFDSGKVVTNFSIAVDEFQGSSKPIKTNWFNCRAWGKKAEYIAEYAKSGSLVFVGGHLSIDSYTTQEGQKRTNTYVIVDDVKIIAKK